MRRLGSPAQLANASCPFGTQTTSCLGHPNPRRPLLARFWLHTIRMANWTRVARLAECPPGSAIERVAEGRVIALYNVEGTVYALDGVCPHQGGPLGDGALEACIVTCPWHGWQFDVRTGQNQLNERIVQPRFDVRVEGEWILVDLG